MPDMPEINANLLRKLAERADSHRGKTVYLVRNADDAAEPYDVADAPNVGPRVVVLALRTTDAEPQFTPRVMPFVLSSIPAVRLRTLRNKGLNDCDAIFTSLVAVEKFVVPYYARFSSPEDVKAMRDGFAQSASALAVTHVPDSIEDEAVPTGMFVLEQATREGIEMNSVPLDVFAKRFR